MLLQATIAIAAVAVKKILFIILYCYSLVLGGLFLLCKGKMMVGFAQINSTKRLIVSTKREVTSPHTYSATPARGLPSKGEM